VLCIVDVPDGAAKVSKKDEAKKLWPIDLSMSQNVLVDVGSGTPKVLTLSDAICEFVKTSQDGSL
jgi:hypothetical protein